VVREAFAANLVGAAALAHGVDQLDAIRVKHAETVGVAKKTWVHA
jgi:hypothetical protein